MYKITLKPDVKDDISYGYEDIIVNVIKSTKYIIIHALEDLTGTEFIFHKIYWISKFIDLLHDFYSLKVSLSLRFLKMVEI